jgi:orotate phosphoribosyltransferase
VNEEHVLSLLRDRGALREGHFLLSGGSHSDTYVEKARVFEDATATAELGRAIAAWYDGIEAVISPAVGAIPLGFAVALSASVRFLYAEREDGRLSLRRGFEVRPGERVLVVEDVVTTGGSAGELFDLLADLGAERLGVAALVDRSTAEVRFPLRALTRVRAETWPADACPLCARGLGIESPGSRHLIENRRSHR